jgi:hypothetical protein
VYAVVAGADRAMELHIPGGYVVRMTVNDKHFVVAMQSAARTQLWAIDTYIRRATTRA